MADNAVSVGKIGLDLVLNEGSFNRQLNNVNAQAKQASNKISSSLKKIGLAVAAAFSVKAIVSFGKECIDLGSNLAEVQNVVDVTFSTMSERVNDFAQNAASSYGLSETMAKKFTGTFGAMAKAYGFSEQQAYDMSTALTALTGDVASFYNISQDEAYTKLKSVFSGETETLKDLGVVMTQNALDAYALANGYGKTTAKMTEAEKVSLRYAFVQQQLAAAQGDFSRTSDSWANQVRVLQLRFDSLKATLGQAFIKVLSPVLKMLNSLIEKISIAAECFSDFINRVFGEDSSSSAAGQAAIEIAEASSDLDNSSQSVSDNLKNAKKSAKEIKNNLAGFDKLNIIGTDDSSDSGDGASSETSAISSPSVGVKLDKAATKKSFTKSFNDVFKNLYEKSGAKSFVEKIQKGINSVNWEKIGENCQSIFKNLAPIAKSTFNGVQKVGKSALGAVGSYIGGVVSVSGKSIETVSGGISNWLNKDKEKISKFIKVVSNNFSTGFGHLSNFFDGWFGNLGVSIDHMRPLMQNSISKLLSGFSDFGIGVGTIVSGGFEVATGSLQKWVEEDGVQIRTFFDDIQRQISDVMTFIGGVFSDIGTTLSDWWYSGGQGIFMNICDMFTDIGTTLMNVYHEWIMPAWDFIMGIFQSAWDNCLKPVFDNIVNFFGKICDCVSTVWNNFLSPLVNWLVSFFGPIFTNIFNAIKGVFDTVFKFIGDVISGFLKSMGGLLDFITGVFSGNWEKAWKGISDFFGGIWDGFWGIVKGTINLIIDGINNLWTGVYNAVQGIVNGLGGISGAIGSLFGQDWSFSMPEKPPLIPKLAQGGIVKAPTLALVGDNAGANTGNPEVVSPLSKLQGMIDKSNNSYDVTILTQILEYLKKLYELFILFKNSGGSCYEFSADIDGSVLFNEIIKQNELWKKRHNGKSAFA